MGNWISQNIHIITIGLVMAGGGLTLWYLNKSLLNKNFKEPITQQEEQASGSKDIKLRRRIIRNKSSSKEKNEEEINTDQNINVLNTRVDTVEGTENHTIPSGKPSPNHNLSEEDANIDNPSQIQINGNFDISPTSKINQLTNGKEQKSLVDHINEDTKNILLSLGRIKNKYYNNSENNQARISKYFTLWKNDSLKIEHFYDDEINKTHDHNFIGNDPNFKIDIKLIDLNGVSKCLNFSLNEPSNILRINRSGPKDNNPFSQNVKEIQLNESYPSKTMEKMPKIEIEFIKSGNLSQLAFYENNQVKKFDKIAENENNFTSSISDDKNLLLYENNQVKKFDKIAENENNFPYSISGDKNLLLYENDQVKKFDKIAENENNFPSFTSNDKNLLLYENDQVRKVEKTEENENNFPSSISGDKNLLLYENNLVKKVEKTEENEMNVLFSIPSKELLVNESEFIKKLDKKSENEINFFKLMTLLKNFLFFDTDPSKKIMKTSDDVSSKISEFCKSLKASFSSLENKFQIQNQVISRLNHDWEETESDREIQNLEIKSSIKNNFTYRSQLCLDLGNPDTDFSYFFNFIVDEPFEELNFFKLINKVTNSLPGQLIQAKLVENMQIFYRSFDILMSKFNNIDNPKILREFITEIAQFILDTYYELSETRSILSNKHIQEKAAVDSLRLKFEKNEEKVFSEIEKNKSLTKFILRDTNRLKENIENVKNNIEMIKSKSLELSKKRQDFDQTLATIAYDTNEITNSFIKSKIYMDDIAFCDLFLSLLNNQSFQDTQYELVRKLISFIDDKNFNSSMFCEEIFKNYQNYLTKVSQKNSYEYKKVKEIKKEDINEKKIKMKQIKIISDVRKEEIDCLKTSVGTYRNKNVELMKEIVSETKFSYQRIFLIAKWFLIIVISIMLEIMIKNIL